MSDREVKNWVTINGNHVPIYEGESVQDAFNRSVAMQNESKKERDIANAKEQSNNLNLDNYAKDHNGIFLTNKLKQDFTPNEIKNMVDKVSEVYAEFGIDTNDRSNKVMTSLDSNDKDLEEMLATGGALPQGILEVNPKSKALREDNFANIYHEMGHLIEFELLHRKMPHARITTTPNMANRIVHEANQYRQKNWADSNDYISNNGLKDNRELVADAVKDYMLNKDKAKPMSQSIVRVLKKYINTTGLGNPTMPDEVGRALFNKK